MSWYVVALTREILGPLRESPEAEAAVILIRALDHGKTFAQAARRRRSRIGQRPCEKAADRLESVRRNNQRACLAAFADSTAGLGREADQRSLFAARCASGEV